MMYSMNPIDWTFGIFLFFIHIAGVLAFLIGFVFFIIAAAKTLSPTRLKTWGLWLLIGGVVLCLFTIGAGRKPFGWRGMMDRGDMMRWRMMDHDQDDMMEMSM